MGKNRNILGGYIQLTRPHNAVIAGVSIFLGAFLAGSLSPIISLTLACFSGVLIAGAANAINDYFDTDTDKINRPTRPIPSGKVTRRGAKRLAMVLYIAGFILATFISEQAIVISATAIMLTFIYSARLKRVPFWGNLTVAFVASIAFIYGGVAVGIPTGAIIPAIFAFFYHFGREVLKDIEDLKGDKMAGAITFPIRYGVPAALRLAGSSFGLLIILTILPFIYGIFNILYLSVVIFGVDLVLVFVIISARKDPGHDNLAKINTILKYDMLVGLLSIYLGAL